MRKYWWAFIIVFVLLIGVGVYLCLPRYKIIQASRSLAWGNNPSTFVMSPAKIEVTNLVWGFPLTIPVKITNSAGDMIYQINYQDPAIFDKGFINADNNDKYSYTWNKKSVDIPNNTTEVVDIKISKKGMFGSSGIEKGIAITQVPQSSGMTILGFSYVLEILIK